jgi:hypothetical protein
MPHQTKMLVCLLALILMAHITKAQTDDCLIPRFFPGQTVTITGSIDAGGMPYRADSSLDSPVEGFIPIGATVTTGMGLQACQDGRNWYWASYETDEGNQGGWIIEGDGTNYWIEPVPLCPYGGLLYTSDYWGYPMEMNYVPGTDNVILTFTPRGEQVGRATAGIHYAFNLTTGTLTETTYPFADIINRDLTDKLGITDWVFNNNAQNGYTLYLSPDQQKILYFVPGEPLSDCAHNCQPITGYIANTDGTNAVELGEFATDAGIARVHWGANERVYLSHITETGIYFSGEICMDGTCARELSTMLEEDFDLPADKLMYPYYPTVSPDGRYLALTPMMDYGHGFVLDLQTGSTLDLPAMGSIASPALWGESNSLWLPMKTDGDPNSAHTTSYIRNLNLNFDEATVRGTAASATHRGENVLPLIQVDNWMLVNNRHLINFSSDVLEVFCVSYG